MPPTIQLKLKRWYHVQFRLMLANLQRRLLLSLRRQMRLLSPIKKITLKRTLINRRIAKQQLSFRSTGNFWKIKVQQKRRKRKM